MSTTYNIDFSDPIKPGFQIKSGAYNGPGGGEADTTLRLFGRGAREWGEAVNENLVRLTENFASASAPSVPISGQMWVETQIYYKDTSVAALSGWYRYNLTSLVWQLIGGTGVVDDAPMSVPTVGHYYYDAVIDQLMGFYSLGKYEPAGYLVRASAGGVGAPGSLVPPQMLFVYDANANGGQGKWSPQSTVVVTTGVEPPALLTGMLWYNTITGNLSVWSGSAWQNLLGPANAAGGYTSTSSGVLNMGSHRIINVAEPILADDATPKWYVDTNFLPLIGGTMSGAINMNNNKISNLGTPTASADATPKWYVDSAVPPGMVSAFGGQAPPTGWLKANGAAISRTTYANLFASIGTTHGAGDGSTTFNLPDLRGEHIRAFDDGRGVDGGRLIGSFQGSQNLTHNHGINDPGHNHYINDPGHSHGVYDPGHSHPLSDPGHTHNSRYGLDTPSGLDRNPGLGQEIGTWGDERHVPTTWSGTGVSISASVSQIGIYGAAAGIWNSPAGAGISTVASGGAEVRVRNIALLFCIKY